MLEAHEAVKPRRGNGIHDEDEEAYAIGYNDARINAAEELINVQAEMQVALGILRLEMGQLPKDGIAAHNLTTAEDRLSKGLAMAHNLLSDLGVQMYHPARHPDVDPR